jgi:hypothetical protein
MNARQIDEATERLRDLQVRGAQELAVGACALGLALAATQVVPALAVPLLVGAIAVSFLGVQALVRRSFLVEDLAGERDAYAIPAVRRFGLRSASPAHRVRLARTLKAGLAGSAGTAALLAALRPELDELIADLEDDHLRWEPSAAVGLERWLNDRLGSFDDPAASAVEARARLRAFLAGFER